MPGFILNFGSNTSGFDAGLARVKKGLQQLPQTTNQATLALSNLSRVAQDAPYGFIGIANNLNPLLESFQRLKQTTGSTGSALSALKGALTGPAGIGLALGVVSSLLISFGDKLFGAKAHMTAFQKVFSEAKDSFVEAQKAITTLRSEIDLAKNGFIAKDGVVKHFNETIGKTVGLVNSLDEAEASLIKNGQAYIDMTLKKAVANIAFGKAAELLFKLEEKQQQFTATSGFQSTEMGRIKQSAALHKISIEMGNIRKEMEKMLDIGNQSEREAGFISRLFGFDFSQSIKIPNLKVRPKELEIKPEKVKINTKEFAREILNRSEREAPLPAIGRGIDSLLPIKKALELLRKVRKENEQLREDEFRKTAEMLSGILTPAFNGLFDALKNGENAFKAFGEAIANSITQMIAKLISLAAVSGILSAIGFGPFAQIFGKLAGIPGKASGGAVGSGRSYIVGERGPELFTPSQSGRIIPNNAMGSLMGSGLQAISVTVNGVISGRDLRLINAKEERFQNRNV